MHLNSTFLSFGSSIHIHLILTLGYLKARLEGCMSFEGAQRFVSRKLCFEKAQQLLTWNMSRKIFLYLFVLICLAFLVVLKFKLCAQLLQNWNPNYIHLRLPYHGKKDFWPCSTQEKFCENALKRMRTMSIWKYLIDITLIFFVLNFVLQIDFFYRIWCQKSDCV